MANAVYNIFKKQVQQGSYNLALTSGTFSGGVGPIYGALVGSNYTVDVDLHAYHDDLTEVVTPSNYVASFLVSSPVITTNNTTNQGVLDAADILLANVTFGSAVRACVLFGSSGLGSASDPLIAYMDFLSNQEVTAGTFQIQWNASGVLALT
jgi:hypothetical protein